MDQHLDFEQPIYTCLEKIEELKKIVPAPANLADEIALKSASINQLKNQSSEVSSDSNIADLKAKLDESEKLKMELQSFGFY